MKCSVCTQHSSTPYTKHGKFFNQSIGRYVQRYKCKNCGGTYCETTSTIYYKKKRTSFLDAIFKLICSGMSQRRIALLLGLAQNTVASLLKIIGKIAVTKHSSFLKNLGNIQKISFDEMETFEHTKCKPLSIVMMVSDERKYIMRSRVAIMPCAGPLASVSRKKYGFRPDHRVKALNTCLKSLKKHVSSHTKFKSDKCLRYPKCMKKNFPINIHDTYKGRRACIVGQGELKKIGRDPLFELNHTCAMTRDNIKRLSRRTWCTTKKPRSLQNILNVYIWFHNQLKSKNIKKPSLFTNPNFLLN
jgi:transposase-like protein